MNPKILGAVVVLLGILLANQAVADGIIIPEPMPPYPRPEYLEIKYHHVDVTINNQYTETYIDQVFHNPNSWDLEGTYIFPLPEGAVVSDFSMWVDGKELKGEILEKDEARKIYEDIVRRMKDPALLEYVDRNTFKARVYPIEGHGDKKIEMRYSEVISCDDGLCEYTYPLNTEKFSSKNLEEVVINVEIKSNVPIKTIYSPTHEIEIKRSSDYEVKISFEDEDTKPDKDFKLFYTISEEDIDINLITYKESGEDGFFLLLLAPKFTLAQDEIIDKDIVFVLDKSGSMAGEKIEQARGALKFCLNSLNPGDKFGIVTFSTSVTRYEDLLESATSSNVNGAIDFVDEIEAIGGTDIHDALITALAMFPEDNRPKIIIFLTDGKPTVGVQDIEQILDDVEERNNIDARVFVFGVGYEVNTHLLDKLSQGNHGTSEYVDPEEDIEIKVSNFYTKVSSPILSSPELTVLGVSTEELYPKEFPDIFKGSQILIFGRYKDSGFATINLQGDVSGRMTYFMYEKYFSSEDVDDDFLPRLWASRKIGYLLDTIRLEGGNDELIDEIIELSKKYGIATPYTSFLILEDEPDNILREHASRNWADSLAPSSGAPAVEAARDLGAYRGAKTVGDSEGIIIGADGKTAGVKYVGSKTFIEKDGFWTDTDYTEGTTTKNLKYGSDNYFEAIANNPELGKYFAVGENVIVCVDGTCIKVDENFAGTEDTIGDLGLSDECQNLENQIKQKIAEANYCEADSDCKSESFSCPFRCFSLVNKNADLTEIKDLIERYNQECIVCLYEPCILPTPEELICVNNRCVEKGQEPPVTPPIEPIMPYPPDTGEGDDMTTLGILLIILFVLIGVLYILRIKRHGKKLQEEEKITKKLQDKKEKK